ncbi:RNA polymerase sigma-70 factor [Embleya sp. AB8]|uniref:RNA polymerase sigma-70 factor n=1 Tax=Embleya sp. AB8 TaxID=3156304 RepID=UPI003C793EB8
MESIRDRDPSGGPGAAVSSTFEAGEAGTAVLDESFVEHRPMLLALAYRMLGSVHDAEDTVQDAFVRWTGTDRAAIANPAAFLTTIVTRLAVDRLRSAVARRETYVGPWLPEPLPTHPDDPADTAALRDSASIAMLLLMDRLTPVERAVFVLREAFALPYDEIATTLERSAASCRQLHRRAVRRVAALPGPVPPADPARGRRLVEGFLSAARDGDLDRLKALLRDDVVYTTDGGGRARAARRPILGADRAARVFASLFARFYRTAELRPMWINHAPAVLIERPRGQQVLYVFEFGADGRAGRLYAVVNPEKLAHLDVAG